MIFFFHFSRIIWIIIKFTDCVRKIIYIVTASMLPCYFVIDGLMPSPILLLKYFLLAIIIIIYLHYNNFEDELWKQIKINRLLVAFHSHDDKLRFFFLILICCSCFSNLFMKELPAFSNFIILIMIIFLLW